MLGDAFCGDESCYDLLGVPRGATTKHIRKVPTDTARPHNQSQMYYTVRFPYVNRCIV